MCSFLEKEHPSSTSGIFKLSGVLHPKDCPVAQPAPEAGDDPLPHPGCVVDWKRADSLADKTPVDWRRMLDTGNPEYINAAGRKSIFRPPKETGKVFVDTHGPGGSPEYTLIPPSTAYLAHWRSGEWCSGGSVTTGPRDLKKKICPEPGALSSIAEEHLVYCP